MRKMIYDGSEDFSELLSECACNGIDLHVVGSYEIVNDIFRELILYEEFDIDSVILINPHHVGYKDEYILSILDDGTIIVDMAKINNEYISIENNNSFLFVFEDVNCGFIKKNNNIDSIEVDYCNEDCENCCESEIKYSHDNNGNLVGFTKNKTDKNWTYKESFYSSNPYIVRLMLDK